MKILALAVLLACARTPDYAQEIVDSNKESKIVALENLWGRAAQSGDLKSLSTMLDDAFVCVDRNGRLLNKAEVLANATMSHGVRISSEPMYVHLHGDTAIVTGMYETRSIEHGRLLVHRDRFLDTWRFKNGGWVAIASLLTPVGP